MTSESGSLTALALDIGGTETTPAAVRGDGIAVEFHRWPTPRADGPKAVGAAALESVGDLTQLAANTSAVGVVVPGFVNEVASLSVHSVNIALHDVPFRNPVFERTGLPVGSGHDVRAGKIGHIDFGRDLAHAGEVLPEPPRQPLRKPLVWQREPDVVTGRRGGNAACLGARLPARQAITAHSPAAQI